MDSINAQNINSMGTGSPDSTIIKEIEPNAPVVTVSLGGPGLGAVYTKPTWDPSPLARLPWTSQHNCEVQGVHINTYDSTNLWLGVTPLNNDSPDIKSWGTYCFPKQGRIYLPDGSNAEYASKTGTAFIFSDTDAISTGKYLLTDGTRVSTLEEWAVETGLIKPGDTGYHAISTVISNTDKFLDENLCQDGTTVNDRLFQAMDDVTHDYQMGSQYASTRALVEIPVFPNQFFENKNEAIYPGPDNSMKLHLDCTYTAHTWNPSPVGRRCNDVEANDRTAYSAFSNSIMENEFISSSFITRIRMNVTSNVHRIHVSHPSFFPSSIVARDVHMNINGVTSNRRAFLPSASWCIYNNAP